MAQIESPASGWNGLHAYIPTGSMTRPLSYGGWFYCKNNTQNVAVARLGSDVNTSHNSHTIYMNGSSNRYEAWDWDTTAVIYYGPGGGIAQDVWVHMMYVTTGTTHRRVYINNATGSTGSTAAKTVPTPVQFSLFKRWFGGGQASAQGYAAYWGCWNSALSSADRARLVGGALPVEVSPETLVVAWDVEGSFLTGDITGFEPSVWGGYAFGQDNSSQAYRKPKVAPPGLRLPGEYQSSITEEFLFSEEQTNSFDIDSYIKGALSSVISVDATLTCTGQPVWISPPDTDDISATPVMVFTIPSSAGNMHFELELDTVNTFDSGNYRLYETVSVQTDWEYDNGSSWQPFPAAGIPNTYTGNECRLTISSQLDQGVTWYRRIRGGMVP